jgi:hypothetical protein
MIITVYFTPVSAPSFEPFIDPYNYCFVGEEMLVPPCTLVICIPCQNIDPDHNHQLENCLLMTHSRGWDKVHDFDYINIFVLDNENINTTLNLEHGELLSTFLIYNEQYNQAKPDKCLMAVKPFLPLEVLPENEFEEMDDDDGYGSM